MGRSSEASAVNANSTIKPYPTYKPSGIEWLGDVPAHWGVSPGRACFERKHTPNDGRKATDVLSLSYGNLVVRPVELNQGLLPASFETYQLVQPGDIICRPTDLQNDWDSLRFGLSRRTGIITSAYMRFVTLEEMSHEYGFLLFHTYDLKKVFYGLGSGLRQNLSWSDFKYLPCLVPPLPEQRAIARYLDYMDSRIQRYIKAKERLIELLEEQKRAVINQAVTRGLDPDVPLKASGVEWLGDVPAHWEVRRLKTMCRMKSGDFIATESIDPAGKYAVYGGNGIRGYTADYNHDGEFVLIGRQGALCGNVHIATGKFWATEHAVVATLSPGHNVSWFGAVLDAMNLNQYSIAAAQPGLAVERIMNLHLPVPNCHEQKQIADTLSAMLGGIEMAVTQSHRQIELINEYRTRLIADVVTGKLDVRDAAANLPDELGDEAGTDLANAVHYPGTEA